MEIESRLAQMKSHFMKTAIMDVENMYQNLAFVLIDNAVDDKTISIGDFMNFHHDICDWGMQKTLTEIALLPLY